MLFQKGHPSLCTLNHTALHFATYKATYYETNKNKKQECTPLNNSKQMASIKFNRLIEKLSTNGYTKSKSKNNLLVAWQPVNKAIFINNNIIRCHADHNHNSSLNCVFLGKVEARGILFSSGTNKSSILAQFHLNWWTQSVALNTFTSTISLIFT